MPRRTKVVKRETLPDPKYGSVLVQQFINKLMLGGKKGLAERIVYDSFDAIFSRTGREPLEVFELAMRNATPVIEVKPRRVGGATLQVPVPIEGPRRASLAIRWMPLPPVAAVAKRWWISCLPRFSMRSTTRATRLSGARIRTAWRKQIRRFRIIDGSSPAHRCVGHRDTATVREPDGRLQSRIGDASNGNCNLGRDN